MDVRVDPDKIKALRLEKSWSQEELAERSGLSLRTIQRMEVEGSASLKSRKAIADALGIDPLALDPCEIPQEWGVQDEPRKAQRWWARLLAMPDRLKLSQKTLNLMLLILWMGVIVSGTPLLLGLVIVTVLSMVDPGVPWLNLSIASLPLIILFVMCLGLLHFFKYLRDLPLD